MLRNIGTKTGLSRKKGLTLTFLQREIHYETRGEGDQVGIFEGRFVRLENLVASTEHIWHDGVERDHFSTGLTSVGLSHSWRDETFLAY